MRRKKEEKELGAASFKKCDLKKKCDALSSWQKCRGKLRRKMKNKQQHKQKSTSVTTATTTENEEGMEEWKWDLCAIGTSKREFCFVFCFGSRNPPQKNREKKTESIPKFEVSRLWHEPRPSNPFCLNLKPFLLPDKQPDKPINQLQMFHSP